MMRRSEITGVSSPRCYRLRGMQAAHNTGHSSKHLRDQTDLRRRPSGIEAGILSNVIVLFTAEGKRRNGKGAVFPQHGLNDFNKPAWTERWHAPPDLVHRRVQKNRGTANRSEER